MAFLIPKEKTRGKINEYIPPFSSGKNNNRLGRRCLHQRYSLQYVDPQHIETRIWNETFAAHSINKTSIFYFSHFTEIILPLCRLQKIEVF